MRATKNAAFAWLTIGVAAALLLPVLAMDGMFMDGMLYSVVAHNQANGFGSFWFPRFNALTVAGLETFHEHPPLVFSMQAIWFRVFGSGFWVEHVYALATALITAWLVVAIWREWTAGMQEVRRLAWMPVLLWIIMPTAHWCYHNNMMENTMGMFTTAAVLLVVKGRQGRFWSMHVAAGVMVFLASMSKGVPGLFPLAAPMIVALFLAGRLGRGIAGAVVMLLVTAGAWGLLMLDPTARAAMSIHVEQRLMHRIAVDPTVEYRLASLELLFSNMAGPLAIVLILWLVGRRLVLTGGVTQSTARPALAMALVGLSGVLPLMLTMVQKSFYLAPALPLMAIALSLWMAPVVTGLLARLKSGGRTVRLVQWLGILATAGAVAAAVVLFGRPHRDAAMLHDVHAVGEVVPRWSVIGTPLDIWHEWNLQGYFMRHHFISVTHSNETEWLLTRIGERPEAVDAEKVELGLKEYELWRRADP
jgi:4-amino-4-deoxy-L-arabinose transferase-like glycosyltransferase